MSDSNPGDLMREYDELADMEEQYNRRKHQKLREIAEALEDAVESAVSTIPPKAEVYDISSLGETHSIRLRLDKSELLKQICDELPDEFAVGRIGDDGTISAKWVENPTAESRTINTILRGIVAEKTPGGEYEPINLLWIEVIECAESLGFDSDTVERRLHELDDLNVIEVFEEDGETKVARGEMFQEF